MSDGIKYWRELEEEVNQIVDKHLKNLEEELKKEVPHEVILEVPRIFRWTWGGELKLD